ncbi:hypothetical protein AVM02_03015 [Brucella anthropi]|uniref:autotransporter-associated beta strand repeat-containing protein n=1 Tax=Brucella anthropi TaxID=529 RepID=UPI0039861B28
MTGSYADKGASLNIEAGAVVTGSSTVSLSGALSTPTLTIEGAGSHLTAAGQVTIGSQAGGGIATLSDGGSLNADAMVIGGDGTGGDFTGVLNIGGGVSDAAAAPGHVVATNGITVNAAGEIIFNHTGTAYEFSSAVSGTGTISQIAGITILSNDNSFSGTTTIRGGTLQIGNGGTHGSLASDVDTGTAANHGSLVFNRSDSYKFDNAITGSGNVVQNGSGTLTLGADNSYSGTTTIATGSTLQVGDGGTTGTLGSGDVWNDGTLTVDRSNSFILSQKISGTGFLTKSGSGTLTLSGNNSYGGATSVSAGTLVLTGANTGGGATTIDAGAALHIGTGGTVGSLAGDIVNNGALVVDRAGTITLAGTISGTGGLTMQGGGTLTLSGTNSYSGDTTVSGSTLMVTSDTNLGNTDAQNGAVGALTLDDATLRIGAASFSTSRQVHLTGNDTIDTGTFDARFDAVIDGDGKLTKQGTGMLTLTAANSYGGGTDVLGGTLRIGGTAGDITGDVTVAGGATLELARSNTYTFYGLISGDGRLVKSGVGTTTLANAHNSYSGGTEIDSGTLAVSTDDNLGDRAGGLTFNGGTLQLLADDFASGRAVTLSYDGTIDTNSHSGTLSGLVTGAYGLVVQGGGTLTLSSVNTYSGDTTVTGASTLVVAQDGNLGATTGTVGALTLNNGTLQIDRDAFSSNRFVYLTGAGTVDTNGHDAMLGGVINGAGTFTKQGTGTLTLSNTNLYGGGTVVAGGTLAVSSDANLGATAGTLSIAGGATLQLTDDFSTSRMVTLEAGTATINTDTNKTATFLNTLTGAGKLNVTGDGTLVLAATNDYNGGTAIASGSTLQLGNATADGSIMHNVANGGTLIFHNQNETIFAGVISGDGALVQNGTGTLILTGDNNYKGGTTIESGSTLQVGAGGATGKIKGNVTNHGTLDFKRSAALTFDGVISGDGTLIQSGTASLTLTGDSSGFTGVTTVANGSLEVNNSLGGTVTVNSGATLGGGGTIGGDTTVNGTLEGTSGQGLTFNGNLTLGTNSVISASFDGPNDPDGIFDVKGNLALGGVVSVTSFGTATPGLYHLFHYDGSKSGTLTIGTLPSGVDRTKVSIDTQGPNDIYIVNSTGTHLNYWNGTQTGSVGDGHLYGGDGTWTAASTSLNWTDSPEYDINGSWTNSDFAVFSGNSGTVTVDPGEGEITASGMQFMVSGYKLVGGSLELVSPQGTPSMKPNIRVGGGGGDGVPTATIATVLTGTNGMMKSDAGTLVLTGINTYTGGTDISGGTLQLGDGTTNGSVLGDISTSTSATDKGVLAVHAGATPATIDNTISGMGSVLVQGGTVTFSGHNSYSGGTTLAGGITIVTEDDNLGVTGSNVAIDNGATLRFNQNINVAGSFTHNLQLGTTPGNIATLDTNGHNVTVSGAISGVGSLTKAGANTLTLTANNTYTGMTRVEKGTLQVGDGGASGDLAGAVTVDAGATLAFDRDTYAFQHKISGAGSVEQRGSGTLTLTEDNDYSGGTSIAGGTLKVASDKKLGAISGDLTLNGGIFENMAAFTGQNAMQRNIEMDANGSTLQTDQDLELRGSLGGNGDFAKTGTGQLTLAADNNDWTGMATIDAGSLRVDGTLGTEEFAQQTAINVKGGATLSGTGTIHGDVTVADNGTLIGSADRILTVDGKLTLGASYVNVSLATPSLYALFQVNGDLDLGNSTLNITGDIGGFGAGTYRIFDYTGSRFGTMTVGSVPAGSEAAGMWVQTDYPGQVNLVNQNGVTVNYWNAAGNRDHNNQTNEIVGGSGTWNLEKDNWTESNGPNSPQKDKLFNARYTNGSFAVFGGTAGQVKVDNASGQITAAGMQFASDGYHLTGGALTLAHSTQPIIRVGDSLQHAAPITATIDNELEGTGGINKTDYGTLILTGDSSYSGGTTVTGGILQLGNGGTGGSITGDVVLTEDPSHRDHGRLVFDHSQGVHSTFAGAISGIGEVIQQGSDVLTLSGQNTFTGGLTVKSGGVAAGVDGTVFGTGTVTLSAGTTLDLANHQVTSGALSGAGMVRLGSGTLTLATDQSASFSGVIEGTGGLTKSGTGTETLLGANSYTGQTTVSGGTLAQGAAGAFNTASSSYDVASGGTLDLGGFDTTLAALSNGGAINMNAGAPGTTLTVNGNYAGNGGTITINTVLGGDNSRTDRLKVGGDTSGNTQLKVVNRGGLGAQTANGIEVVEVSGQSNGTFSLTRDYLTKDGQPAVVAGAYAYTLHQGPAKGSNDGNWYLTSQFNNSTNPDHPDNPDPRYGANVPVYQGYVQTMQALNKLPTLQERVGKRYWTGENGDGRTNGAVVDERGIWARIEGAHNRLDPHTATGMKQDINTFLMQAGVDGQFYEDENGKFIAGITGQYGTGHSDISARDGDGSIATSAWSLGATATWYGNNGLYVDTQGQLSWFDNDLNSDTANTGLKDGAKAFGYALSVEAGQRVAIDDRWSLTPQAQLMWSAINADDFQDVWQADVAVTQGNSLTGRIGLAASYDANWQGTDGRKVNTSVYGIANLYQEFLGGTRINVSGVGFNTDNDRTWAGVGAGGTYAWADTKYLIYGQGTINTSLNQFANSYSLKATAGFKVKW